MIAVLSTYSCEKNKYDSKLYMSNMSIKGDEN